MRIPAPLTSGHICQDCRGTGANIKATLAHRPVSDQGYIVCHSCNGNGLDQAEYFTWSNRS